MDVNAVARAVWHWKVAPRLLPRLLGVDPPAEGVLRLGTWTLPRQVGPVVYAAGVGEEINLELYLIARMGCQVWSFDPTPRSIHWVETIQPAPGHFHFRPEGLWKEDTTLFFQSADNADNVSASLLDADRRRPGFDAPVRRLGSVMTELGHDHIDLLKLNIEGAEGPVLETLFEDRIWPTTIALTFEGRQPLREAREWTRRLAGVGYRVIGVHGWAVTYLRSDG